MRTTGKFILLTLLAFTVSVVVAGLYMLDNVRVEAYRQSGLDMERRLKTFWQLAYAKGEQFSIRENKLFIGEYQVNGNYELPDKVREIFGGTATIFMGDVRVSTNVPREDGSRAIGTKLVGPAYDAVFKRNESYRGTADILGVPYLTAYDPIRDQQGRVIGVLYVGVEKGVFLEHYDHLMLGLLVPVAFLAIVSVVLYLLLVKEGRLAEQEQKRSLDFLQTMLDALPTPVYYKNLQGCYLGCNSAFERFLNTTRDTIIGKTAYDIAPPELAAAYAQDDKRLFEATGEQKHQFESKAMDLVLGERDVIFYKACFRDSAGKLAGLIGAMLDITERKAVEDQLRSSEQQLSDVINFLPDATWVIDHDGKVVSWNKACEELTGLQSDAIIGQGDYAYAIPFYGKRRPMLIDGALHGASLENQNYCVLEQELDVATAEAYAPNLRLGQGAYVWGTARRLFDKRGRVIGAIETVRDVTERKQAELREHARADILEHIAKDASISDVLTAIALDVEQERPETFCSILLVNTQGDRLVHGAAPSLPQSYNAAVNGLKIKEGMGSCGTAAFLRRRVVVPDIVNHPYWSGFQPALDAGLKSCWSEPIISASGDLYGTFALYSQKVWDPGPEEIRLIVTAANYASIAIERMHTINALKESERKYRELVENANSIIMRLDPEGRITYFNEYAQHFFGYTEAEIIGQHVIGTIVPMYESSGRNLVGMVSDICSDPETYALNENENMRKNGELVFISWANKACRSADGRLEELLCIGQDITERKRMQEIMVQTEKMMTVGGLAAGMAHELNNPIGTIVQHTQNIIRRTSGTLPANLSAAQELGIEFDDVTAYLRKRGVTSMLEAINGACERAATIISNMLTFSRKSTSQFEPAMLPGLVDKALELAACDYDLKKQYDFRNVRIVRDYAENLPAINVVPLEIEQVLLNLLKNAAQSLALHQSDTEPQITIRIKADERFAVIEIEDNGPGIDSEQRSRIFEPFFTTKEVGVGTGLGLSISYSIIVNKHLGSITVESPPGKGACFSIKLPLNLSESAGFEQ